MDNETDNWTLAQYRDPESPQIWIFRKNQAPSVKPGSASHPHVCYLTFGYVPEDASGLPSSEDATRLQNIEATDVLDLERGGLAVLVGVALKNGIKDFIFYTSDPKEFLVRAAAIRDSHIEFKLGCEVAKDKKWSHYLDFPGTAA
jgi:hypothetical protein